MRYLIFTILCFFIMTNSSINAQIKEVKIPLSLYQIETPIFSNEIMINNKQGIDFYRGEDGNDIINGIFFIFETALYTDTDRDISCTGDNNLYSTGYDSVGSILKGYKNGFWKATYENKLIKTENWNNGLIIGRYRVYNTKGQILYKTTFGSKGNGKFKDYYYKTGIIKQEGSYKNGKKQGEWCDYDENGNTLKITYYEKGIPKSE